MHKWLHNIWTETSQDHKNSTNKVVADWNNNAGYANTSKGDNQLQDFLYKQQLNSIRHIIHIVTLLKYFRYITQYKDFTTT